MSPKRVSNEKKAFKSCVKALSKIEPAVLTNEPSVNDTPKAVSKEDFLRNQATKGEPTQSLLEASSNHRKVKAVQFADGPKAKIIIVSVLDASDLKEYSVCAMLTGDLYPVRDFIKVCATDECTVNGVSIPMVADCLKPKYISKIFWISLKPRMPFACRDFAKFLAANVEQCWLLYAPYNDSNVLNGAAAVDTAVPLYEYAQAWKRALAGKPLHYEDVDIVHYFVGLDELNMLDEFYHTKDPHFGQRTSIIRR
mmetsp:Transcript_17181/g.29968  ORF Transcript_17181/g.29968 Transcript_17181/m.29968 type:complete len:253 (-) Transcript_17181:127-885(-)|eukprot:CAMPEP_0184996410 /NCGR_PEP_ID=MMETSP1098-20130426/56373_1 /TAXON_ID=89044 /ORGANISM="Spumella elongata, Strain CCAP 955/1" /LENGTH=252 /DNA_ID=CAMNT_0027522855 /DNA_START=32 /DNA_END=790 /DNA_ORIENTATION=-